MSFNSLAYLIFLPTAYIIYYFSPQRFRWAVLFTVSIVFYAALQSPALLLALFFVVLVSFISGLEIGSTQNQSARKKILILGLFLVLIPLVFLKYLPVIAPTVYESIEAALFPINQSTLRSFSAIGVSFFVFQAISYMIDIYLGQLEPEKHLGIYALSLSFFPKILQGPIERSGSLLPQLHKSFQFNYENTRAGLLQIAWGMFIKLIIADRLGMFVNPIYDAVNDFSGPQLIFATYLYGLQIYLDFSAYTGIALGSARLFNIDLTKNFNRPYLARTVGEFWRRWHISLSSWLLDYIFKPLQIQWRNYKTWGTAAALILTFLISGAWHGAGWTFILWGLLHGFYLAAEALLAPYRKRFVKRFNLKNNTGFKVFEIILTFNLVSFAWIFFRANSLSDAFYIVAHLFTGWGQSFQMPATASLFQYIQAFMQVFIFEQSFGNFLIVILGIICVVLISILETRKPTFFSLSGKPFLVRWSVYYLLVGSILIFGIFNQPQFIYFKF